MGTEDQAGVMQSTDEIDSAPKALAESKSAERDSKAGVGEVSSNVYLTPVAQVARAQIWGQTVFFTIANPRDVIQGFHSRGKFYEPEELEIIRTFMEPGSTLCDIGANVGNHTIFALKYLRTERVILFEPNPTVIPVLLSNIALNGLANRCDSSFLGYGLSDETAKGLSIALKSARNLGGAKMVAGKEGGSLEVIRGDDALSGRSVDFLKIDVEGMELKVLTGLSETISLFRPRIFVEVDNSNSMAFREWVERFGYRIKASFRRYRANENFMLVPKRVRHITS